jgi:steroid 5-alpha reductase family enzyme
MEMIFVCMLVYVVVVMLAALVLRDPSIANFTWGGGVFVFTWVLFLFDSLQTMRQLILLILVSIWFSRLSSYLIARYIRQGTDTRYSQWTVGSFGSILLHVCALMLVQIPLMIAMSMPSILVMASFDQTIDIFVLVGVLIWLSVSPIVTCLLASVPRSARPTTSSTSTRPPVWPTIGSSARRR